MVKWYLVFMMMWHCSFRSGVWIDGTWVRRETYRIMDTVYINHGTTFVHCWYELPTFRGFLLPPGRYLLGMESHGYSLFHAKEVTEAEHAQDYLKYPVPVEFGRLR